MSTELRAELRLSNISRRFGGLAAVSDVSLVIPEGQITGLIGPNGAGKTTLFNLVTGTLRPTSGEIHFGGARIDGRDPGDVARRGLVRSFQSPMVLPGLTVAEHLRRAALFHAAGCPRDLLRRRSQRAAEAAADTLTEELLAFSGLGAHAAQEASALAYGLQKVLGLAMALASRPRLLLADEPAAGLNGAETAHMETLLRAIRAERGVSLVVIEHDLPMVMRLCERIVVLAQGEVIADGPPGAVRHDPAFIAAYLGSDAHAA
ncbi:ABC transporter ATP-binding protein [Xanthobacter oligotrophicus]|uniref:ABC transporter ATP-binding protein n=1 Tax=Xanthobacter oligotrophicus TaxID=2607286 RepID=A0ABW6ZU51_9HYPH